MSLSVEEIIAEIKCDSKKASLNLNDENKIKKFNFKNKFAHLFSKFFHKSKETAKSNYYKQMPMYTDGCEDHFKAFNVSIDFDKSLPLAIVIPWFGEDIVGGAEKHAYELAYQLAQKGFKIDVLTTCSKSFRDEWSENFHEPGTYNINGIQVKRFLVDSRNKNLFDEINKRLLSKTVDKLHPLYFDGTDEENEIWKQENINSSSLNQYISKERSKYNAFIFMPYLYGVALKGIENAQDKAWLQPCLHNESYAYLRCVRESFINAKGIFFNSLGEQQLAANIYGPFIWAKGIVVGEGITFEKKNIGELPQSILRKKFILYLGRRCNEKNTDILVEKFADFKNTNPSSDLTLVLAGPGENLYSGKEVFDLGLVTEDLKNSLLKNCRALIQPSTNESFSRVIFEAWNYKKAVIVNQNCLATAHAVKESKGGYTVNSNWSKAFTAVEKSKHTTLTKLGNNGDLYRKNHYTWEKVINKYESVFIDNQKKITGNNKLSKVIYQVLPDLAYGDAVSNEAIYLHKLFQLKGFESIILVRREHIDKRVEYFCTPIENYKINDSSILIYHYSIGSDLDNIVLQHKGIKVLRFHSITPPEYFQNSRPEFTPLLRDGLEKLWDLSLHFDYSVCTSKFTSSQLAVYGFKNISIISLNVDPQNWSSNNNQIYKDLKHSFNLLFVGRFAPNKDQKKLIKIFRSFNLTNPNTKLIMVGSYDENDDYYKEVKNLVHSSNLQDSILIPNHVNDAKLFAYYRLSDVFCSTSTHEGFGVPLIEAMWFDLPVIALDYGAIAETVSNNYSVVENGHCEQFIHKIHELYSNRKLCQKIIKEQRVKRVQNCSSIISQKWSQFVMEIISNNS
jgi:glycosyltransferase involved in cell wall biosynthesis